MAHHQKLEESQGEKNFKSHCVCALPSLSICSLPLLKTGNWVGTADPTKVFSSSCYCSDSRASRSTIPHMFANTCIKLHLGNKFSSVVAMGNPVDTPKVSC